MKFFHHLTMFKDFNLYIHGFFVSIGQWKVCMFLNTGRVKFMKEFIACFLPDYVLIIYLQTWLIQILFQPPLISSPMNMVRSNKIDKQLQTRNKTTPKVTNICAGNCRILPVKLTFMPNLLKLAKSRKPKNLVCKHFWKTIVRNQSFIILSCQKVLHR